jgi:hypothetical protein
MAVPTVEAWTMGYRFPREPATPGQLRALDKIMLEFLRLDTVKRFPDLSIELVGKLFDLGERQAQTVVSNARRVQGSADFDLVIRILHGMHSNEIAGVLGTPKSKDTRSFFRRVYEFDFLRYGGELPDCLGSSWKWIPLPPDAVLTERRKCVTARLKSERGSEQDLIVYEDENGSPIVEVGRFPSDFDVLRMFHAAFCVDYREWLMENR